jgi:hypothetical protein
VANTILAYPDYVVAEASTVSFSGGSWRSALPLANLLLPEFAYSARSTDATLASTQFTMDLGTTRDVRVFAIPSCNGSMAAKLRVRAAAATSPALEIAPSYALDLETTALLTGPEIVGYVDAVTGYESANLPSCSSVRVTAPAPAATGSFTWVLEWTGPTDSGTVGGFSTAAGFAETCYVTVAPGSSYLTCTSPNFNVFLPGVVSGRNRVAVQFNADGMFVYCNGEYCGGRVVPTTYPAYDAMYLGGSPWWRYTGHEAGPAMAAGAPLYGAVYDALLSASELQRLSLPGADATAANPLNPALADTGWRDLFAPSVPPLSQPWGSALLWDGMQPSVDARLFPRPFVAVFDDPVVARYWFVEFDDTGNGDGYIDLPRVVASPAWQPSRNFSYGAAIGVEDSSAEQTSQGGADFFSLRAKRRTTTFSLAYLPAAEAHAIAGDMKYRLGRSGQLFFIRDPDDEMNMARHSFLARLRSLSALEATAHGYETTSFELLEVVA